MSALSDRLTRLAARAFHVLRTEGPAVLLRKLHRRLRGTPFRPSGPPRLVSPRAPLAPLDLRAVDSPRIRIVIPVIRSAQTVQEGPAALARPSNVQPVPADPTAPSVPADRDTHVHDDIGRLHRCLVALRCAALETHASPSPQPLSREGRGARIWLPASLRIRPAQPSREGQGARSDLWSLNGSTAVRLPFEVILVGEAAAANALAPFAAYPGLDLKLHDGHPDFAAACNLGAAGARGAWLVFLSPETQAQPDWLAALIRTFADRPDAGLVGSRLLDPDGRQQAVGGLLTRDGALRWLGHRADPDRPEYGFLRPVDTCPAAALAIPTAIFEKLGGFDPGLTADADAVADLALRIQAAGRRAYCQPVSRVVLDAAGGAAAAVVGRGWTRMGEGFGARWAKRPPSGAGRAPAPVAAQGWIRTGEVFRARWAEFLARREPLDADPALAWERALYPERARRVLAVDRYMLTPDRESGSVRMFHLLRLLAESGDRVTFAAANLEAPPPYVADLQRVGVEVLYRPQVPSLKRHLAARGAGYDLVILSRADTAAELLPVARRHCPRARIVFDTVDLHFLREERLAELNGDPIARQVAARRREQELALMRAADLTFVVSEIERELLAAAAPDVPVRLVSNIHPVFGSARPPAERRDLLFIGAFAHPPNRDAVLFLCTEILPELRARGVNPRLHVIGADPPPEIQALAAPDVNVLGYVPEVVPWFACCRLSVAPLRYGAGVKGKINQSLAHGLPVVATRIAAEGMHLVDGESVLLADTAPAFADAVLRLLTDDALWERLSAGGLAVMEAHFGFAAARRSLRQALESLPIPP